MIRILLESVDLNNFPIGKIVWVDAHFIKNGHLDKSHKIRPVIVVEHLPDHTTNVVPVEEYGDEMKAPRMGSVNAVTVTSYKPDANGVLLKSLDQQYDVDLDGYTGEGIWKPCKATCRYIYNLDDEAEVIPCEVIDQKYLTKILRKYIFAKQNNINVYPLK